MALLLSLPGMLGARWPSRWGARGKNPPAPEGGSPVPLRLEVRNATPLFSGQVRARLTVENTLTGQRETERFTFTAAPQPQVLEHQLSSPTCGVVECRWTSSGSATIWGLSPCPCSGAGARGRPSASGPPWPGWTWRRGGWLSPDGEGERYSQRKAGDDPTELFALREWREGDRLSRVHWKLSQKWGGPLSRSWGFPFRTTSSSCWTSTAPAWRRTPCWRPLPPCPSFCGRGAGPPGGLLGQAPGLPALPGDRPGGGLAACVAGDPLGGGALAPALPGGGGPAPGDFPRALPVLQAPAPGLGPAPDRHPAARISVLRASGDPDAAREAGEGVTLLRPGRVAEGLNGFLL